MPTEGLGTILAGVSNPGCSHLPVPIPLQMKHLVPPSDCSCKTLPETLQLGPAGAAGACPRVSESGLRRRFASCCSPQGRSRRDHMKSCRRLVSLLQREHVLSWCFHTPVPCRAGGRHSVIQDGNLLSCVHSPQHSKQTGDVKNGTKPHSGHSAQRLGWGPLGLQ